MLSPRPISSGTARLPPLFASACVSHGVLQATPQGHREAGSSGDNSVDVSPPSVKGEWMLTPHRQNLANGRDDVLKLNSAQPRVQGNREQPVRRRFSHGADAPP